MNGLKGRRELKHAITKADCHLLRKNLQNFMRLDPHGLDGKYLIRSVYFDNFDNKILRQKTEGFYHRDKFRARLYDHNANFINLEKKSKRNNLTYKQKCRLSAREYERIRSGDIDWMSEDPRDILRDLYIQMTLFQIKPTTVVDYEREVFIYEYGNVRVTFDSNVKTSYRDTDFLNPELIVVDALDPDCVILEIKFDEFLPDIIKQLLSIIDTRKTAFSKYQLSRRYG
ncbi:polyphosphate polymerase domain-containing protein [Peribacillus simplex]|uniref:polyphosphate polymerase domain-containing protein n=1 Tax=Peribacillus simplex TaxID=1478 RepID=UPI0024C1BFCB|nr:polyphosphate polymerase domain-containing protein [Peribacillus simplex]WHY97652.1 polyphosphate polymerase domain-containing protein [Peribacillus simplex]